MAHNPDDYAIVIGINSYSQLPILKGAHTDATAFMQWLISPDGGGLAPEKVKLILSPDELPADPFDAQPTQRDIDRALRDFGFEQPSRRIGRRFYFYFAGYGVGPSFDELCLLMADASMARPNSNLGMRLYRQLFRETARFDEVVFILDCCRDPVKATAAAPSWALPAAPLGNVVDFVLMAAAYGEKAIEGTEDEVNQRRGLLTRAILEGLNPEAADALGRITASTLKEYVLKRVPELALATDETDKTLQQKPEIIEIIMPNTDLVFATIPAEKLPKLRVHIIASPSLTGDLILRHGTDLHIIERRSVALATADQPWEIELLRNISYLVQHSDSDLAEILDLRRAKDEPYVFRFPRPE